MHGPAGHVSNSNRDASLAQAGSLRETLDWRDAPGWLPAGVCPTRPCMLSFTSGCDAECRMHAVGWAIESESENARPGVIEREGGNSAGCV